MHGLVTLLLLPHHPDLNPIESEWGKNKGKVAHQKTGASSIQHKERNGER